jgi:nicotinate phosphoribosyltransferase
MKSPTEDGFVSGPLELRDAALFTDLYELTMAASYFRERMTGQATFSLFVRRLPPERPFLLAAGLEDVLNFLQHFHFSERAVAYLGSLGRFDRAFLEHLKSVRFSGTVRAVPEGTPIFADEPLLEITAPIMEAQLVEAAVLNFCHFQTLLATKAARCVLAARGRPVLEFGLRRTHGMDAGMKAARCAYIAGAVMSSNVLAGLEYGIPPTGTMAHSYVTAFPREIDAFRAFARASPQHTILLIDTYDTIAAAHKAVEVAREMERDGRRLAAVRLDSGDIVELSKQVRKILDQAGLSYVKIFVSGGLDEYSIEEYLAKGAVVDAFGVGTRMDVSADVPYLDMAYKLVRYDGRDVLKISQGKQTLPGEKQVWRQRGADGRYSGDTIALKDEPPPAPGAEPLLRTVMENGRVLEPHPPLTAIRDRCARALRELPEELVRIRDAGTYPVRFSDALTALQRSRQAELVASEVAPVTASE